LGVLYVVSVEKAVGKTAVCAGLAKNLLNEGKKVGYLKPTEASGADGDIAFMKQILGLTDVVNAPDLIQGRDVILVEESLGTKASDTASQAAYRAAKDMKARVIAVEAYSSQASRFVDAYKGFGGSLLGVVLNKVPESQLEPVREEASKHFGKAGIKLLGVVPENRVLLAITVGELADIVRGKILNNTEKSTEMVENYMLGAMVVDSGLGYFERKTEKAAIVRQDRPDMQLAALETPTKCLVLSGSTDGAEPLYNVLQKAESRGIPIITTETTAGDIVASIEEALGKARCHQEKKLTKLAEIVKQSLDVKTIV
jgi:BioD-like phosphotransacetylase family protein